MLDYSYSVRIILSLSFYFAYSLILLYSELFMYIIFPMCSAKVKAASFPLGNITP